MLGIWYLWGNGPTLVEGTANFESFMWTSKKRALCSHGKSLGVRNISHFIKNIKFFSLKLFICFILESFDIIFEGLKANPAH